MSLQAGSYLTTWRGIAIQQLTIVGAPLPPMPLPGVTVSALGCLGTACLSSNSTQLSNCIDWLVFQFSSCRLHVDPQWTPLPAIPLFLHDITTGMGPQRTPFPAILPSVTLRGMTYSTLASLFIVPLSSDGCLFWLNYSGFQQTCHNI
jgi:hypothetical protein